MMENKCGNWVIWLVFVLINQRDNSSYPYKNLRINLGNKNKLHLKMIVYFKNLLRNVFYEIQFYSCNKYQNIIFDMINDMIHD